MHDETRDRHIEVKKICKEDFKNRELMSGSNGVSLIIIRLKVTLNGDFELFSSNY